MRNFISYIEARDMLINATYPVATKHIELADSIGMVIAEDITAKENVPPFDRSPYDGYAIRSADTEHAASNSPVELHIIEEVLAGSAPIKSVTTGTAVKILTGAPIPNGADAVIMYEKTEFTEALVRIFSPIKKGSNIIQAGEDVRAGQPLIKCGTIIDSGVVGTLAAQGILKPLVYSRPRIGIISTGNEIIEVGTPLQSGKIYNSSRFILEAELKRVGCETVYIGIVGDCAEKIALRISKALEYCDAVILTGGVSAGDYDLTPEAMKLAGVDVLVRGISMKPGMACAHGAKDGKLICGLSGAPVSAMINLQMVVVPALKKLCGQKNICQPEISVTLATPFPKKSKNTRILYGRLNLEDGAAKMYSLERQGNSVISGTIGYNLLAIIPAGSDILPVGTKLKGLII